MNFKLGCWLLQGPYATPREDMDLNLRGIGAVAEDGFWRIYHPEFEALHDD